MNKCVLFCVVVAILSATYEAKNIETRIVEGSPAVNFQFPWHVLLRITHSNSAHESFCGGALISASFVLTAASCLRQVMRVQCDFGSILFSQPLVTLHSTQVLSHPQYNANFNTNDVAIIRLPQPVAFSTNIRAINLPTQSQAIDTFENREVYIAGFGVTTPNGNVMSEQLRFAHQRVITNNQCLQHFNSQFVQASTMCASGIDNSLQTPCFGDRGGGLVSHIFGTWTLVGITSFFHPAGCTGMAPAGYERITSHLQWISFNTGIPIVP
ncbi:collagenase-like [Bradysia coprophila]|uniref:collagenase-like n=1 Tax=Bradysia coprophila TaxID=38358 RepID=UPI00187DC6EE|nr:collagenase-like [Bradysia coprophila]